MRRALLIGNWKLNKTIAEARAFVGELRALPLPAAVEVVVAPSTTALFALAHEGATDLFALCGQACGPALAGPHTGDTSAELLRDAGARYCLLGHSESRAELGVSDERVAGALAACLAAQLTPILCLGESLAARERGETESALALQLDAALARIEGPLPSGWVVAYEPVWAIGQDRAPPRAVIGTTLACLDRLLCERLGHERRRSLRVVYGGGVQPADARSLIELDHLDGLLLGKASLRPAALCAIAESMASGRGLA